jgi:hypothetical protein
MVFFYYSIYIVYAILGPTSDLPDLIDDVKNYSAECSLPARRALLHLTWMCDNNGKNFAMLFQCNEEPAGRFIFL